jgi:hypothetical protein
MSIPEPKQWSVTITTYSEEEYPDHEEMSTIIIDALWDAGYQVSVMYRTEWDLPLTVESDMNALLIAEARE